MKLQAATQSAPISDAARARIALTLPIMKGILFALQSERVARLGGHEKITLADLAREYREGSGDCGICFEYAVHDAIRGKDPTIHALISNVLEDFCGIRDGAESILFGAEKTGALSLIETPTDILDSDSRVLSGKVGQPAKLLKNWDPIKKALRSVPARARLPASIRGLWKADLFLGSSANGRWVGSTLKLNRSDFEGAPGLRLGIYPETKKGEGPSRDASNNLVLCPLPYDAQFMEIFYSAFFLMKQFLGADAKLPKPVALPNSADRFVAQQLEERRTFTVVDIVESMYGLGQPGLTGEKTIGDAVADVSVPLDAVAPVPKEITK